MMHRRWLYNLFTNNAHENDPRHQVSATWVRWDDAIVVAVVLLNLVVMQLETIPGMGSSLWIRLAERGCLLFFLLELGLRFYAYTGMADYRIKLSRPRTSLRSLHRFFNFDHLVDLTVVVTGILSELHWLIDLKLLSMFQLVRLLRLLKLTRYLASTQRLGRSFKKILPDLMVSLGMCLGVMVVASYIFYQVEHAAQPEVVESAPAAMWWAIITLTTVGYGDLYPVTVAGKILTAVTAVSSIGLLAIPAGLFAQALLGGEDAEGITESEQMQAQMQRLEDKLDILMRLQHLAIAPATDVLPQQTEAIAQELQLLNGQEPSEAEASSGHPSRV